jgi:hypothetical protein
MKFVNYVLLHSILCGIALAKDPVNVGGRRELFLDDVMVERMVGGAQRVFHHPVAREVVMKFDKPWEGNACGDGVVFRDGDIYRMYYRALDTSKPPGFTCYAESRDGITQGGNGITGLPVPDDLIVAGIRAQFSYASVMQTAAYRFGEGRFIFNTLRITENLGTDPVAERLLRNLINYAAPDLANPPAALPADFDQQLKAIGYQ